MRRGKTSPYLEVVICLALLDPVEGLLLGVYTHGEATGAVGEDPVLDGEFVRGESLRRPPGGHT